MEFQKLIEERRTIRVNTAGEQDQKKISCSDPGAQEAPAGKNSQTGRYYCVMSEEMVEKVSRELSAGNEPGKSRELPP